MTIRLDGQTVPMLPNQGHTVTPHTPRRPGVAQNGRLLAVLSPEARDLIDAMRVCQVLMQPENKQQVPGGILTTQNEMPPCGLKKLARIHATLEHSLDAYLKAEDVSATVRRLKAKHRKARKGR